MSVFILRYIKLNKEFMGIIYKYMMLLFIYLQLYLTE